MSAETTAGRTASLHRQRFAENAEQAKQEHAHQAGVWHLQQRSLISSPSSLHGKEPRVSSWVKIISVSIPQSTNSQLRNKFWSTAWNRSLRKNQALEEQMGFWHPTASTQHFRDDAAWLLPTPSSNQSCTQIPLHKTPPSPNNSQHIMNAEGGYPPPPGFGVKVNFFTSVLRNYHYADPLGSIFCSRWLKHHQDFAEHDPQHLPRHVTMARAVETPCNTGRPLSSTWESQGTEGAH